jgi:hypothetical protein
MPIVRYWIFAACCFAVAIFILRLVRRERITLQGSLFSLVFLAGLGGFALWPSGVTWLSEAMGFTLTSNFLFAAAILGLLVAHLFSLITLSRVELRSITLTQEIAILQERLDRLSPE